MKDELLISRQWLSKRIVLLVFLVAATLFSILATSSNKDTRSRATPLTSSPTLLELTRLPATTAKPPYLRLFALKRSYHFGEKIPVDVYLNTGDTEIVETTLALTFDGTILTLDPNDIVLADVFKSIQITSDKQGEATVSLFVTPQVGHKPVKITETKIATLNFTNKAVEPIETQIKLDFIEGSSRGTSVASVSGQRGGENALNSVENISLSITP